MENYADLMFHDAVTELQKQDGSFDKYQAAYGHRTLEKLRPEEIGFLKSRESFYIASVTPEGWPYVQHRGGAQGFIKVVGPNRIACADYRGNRQFITMGNLTDNARVSLFFMDYMNKARMKVQGLASLVGLEDADPELRAQVVEPGTRAERLLVVDIVALDWNCPQYIPRLYSEDAIRQVVGGQMAALEAENAALKQELAQLKGASG
ncbi:MAG: pyridoxamine 5'-phosphate oxidase family protein [Rhodobacteraceae bacterium]|nr:pyridoxamine 5'-phosphate oxidase family protein [Paracoccaceae bacterium]